jgi:hypothetical protein
MDIFSFSLPCTGRYVEISRVLSRFLISFSDINPARNFLYSARAVSSWDLEDVPGIRYSFTGIGLKGSASSS